MAFIEESNEMSDELRVKDEQICYSQSISQTKEVLSIKMKEEPKDIEMQTSKSHIEVQAGEEEEKFSSKEEFTNKISIAFWNEEPATSIEDNNTINTNKATTSKSQKSKAKNIQINKLQKSK